MLISLVVYILGFTFCVELVQFVLWFNIYLQAFSFARGSPGTSTTT